MSRPRLPDGPGCSVAKIASCPCGSGRKARRCHRARASTPSTPLTPCSPLPRWRAADAAGAGAEGGDGHQRLAAGARTGCRRPLTVKVQAPIPSANKWSPPRASAGHDVAWGLPAPKAETMRRGCRCRGFVYADPEGAEPYHEWLEPYTEPEWRGGKQIFDENHNAIHFPSETHLTDAGDEVVFQDHYTGHRNPGEEGYQPPHLHIRPIEDARNGVYQGCEEHYPYDPKLGRPPQPYG